MIPYGAIEICVIVYKKMLCVGLFFIGLLQDLTYCEKLIDGGLVRSEDALIRLSLWGYRNLPYSLQKDAFLFIRANKFDKI